MNWPSVSIAFPCWRRGALLEKTLDSIRRQKYPGPLELIVVEEEDDGYTKKVAEAFGAKYIHNPRLEPYPVFQSITELWNLCLHACTGEIAILQTAEVLHESSTVIEELVLTVDAGSKILATPLIKDLAQDGSFAGWYNHPREGSRPGWVSGAGPHAFRRQEMLEIGGYEELFYGYGHEDDYLFHLLRLNGWSIEYVDTITCAHQWHERIKFEDTTGYANRSLIRTLIMEIEDGKRKPVANRQPLEYEIGPGHPEIRDAVLQALALPMSETYKRWVEHCWLGGDQNVDLTFVAQRTIANEGQGILSQIGEMVLEAAWARQRADEAFKVSRSTDLPSWSGRARICGYIHETWASRSIARARKLMEECEKSSSSPHTEGPNTSTAV
jgi:hypothetical protein